MRTISRKKAVQFIRGSHGRFVAVIFVKRTTGELRRMKFRLGVKKHLKGGQLPYDARVHNLITVYDMDRKEYRSIPTEGMISLKVQGEWRDVT